MLGMGFGLEKEVETRSLKNHSEELHNSCCFQDMIRVIKVLRMRCVRHVACLGDVK
jgi:hypothetical protein